MKKRVIINQTVAGTIGLILVLLFPLKQIVAFPKVDLDATINRKSVQLGEIVTLSLKIKNKSKIPAYLVGGMISMRIAESDGNIFRYYAPPSHRFLLDGINYNTPIKKHGTLIRNEAILWNQKPEVSGLNEEIVRSETEGRIRTDYAFPVSGIYLIKVGVCISDIETEGGKMECSESKPLEIEIKEPIGDDLIVWNRIKNNGEFGYFIQEGNVTRGYQPPEKRSKFLQDVTDILVLYPKSIYALPLRTSYNKYNKTIESRIGLN